MIDSVSKPAQEHPPPLDFEDVPKSADDIHLERHGCLLFLAARCVTSILFSSAQSVEVLPVFPNLVTVFANFLNPSQPLHSMVSEEPEPLIDSLLSLAVVSSTGHLAVPQDETTFQRLVLSIVACTRTPAIQSTGRIRIVASTIFRGNPDALARFHLIYKVFEDDELSFARESAVDWLKEELLPTTSKDTSEAAETKDSIFQDASHFSKIFAFIYRAPTGNWTSLRDADISSLLGVWASFTHGLTPYYLSILNFYFLLIKSPILYSKLDLKSLSPPFKSRFFLPLKGLAQSMSTDTEITARIDMEVGSDVERMGRSGFELILHTMSQIEEVQPEIGDEIDT